MKLKKSIQGFVYASSFAMPFAIIVLVYIAQHIAPFGDKTLLIADAPALYISDLSFISRALAGRENLLYSFELGVGSNLMASHMGALNPANAIAILFDITGYPTMYSWLIAIDMSLCGVTMFHFLHKEYSAGMDALVFSTAYALMGYNVANCFQYSFLLSAELLPLMALGLRRLLRGGRPWLYMMTLGYSVLSSFYFGYMLCIAAGVMALAWHFGEDPSARVRTSIAAFRVAAATVAAVLIPSIVWIPALLSLSGGRLDQTSMLDFTLSENFGLLDPLSKLFMGANNTDELVNGLPNVFCGSLPVFFGIAFCLDGRNGLRLRLSRALPLAFYYLTFYASALSMAMQGFSTTNWFNYRYSFVFTFLLLVMAFEEFRTARDIPRELAVRTSLAFAALVCLAFLSTHSFVSGGGMLLDVTALTLCLGALAWNRVDEGKAPWEQVVALVAILCSLELYMNYVLCLGGVIDWGKTFGESQTDLLYGSASAEAVTTADTGFYRMASEYGTVDNCNNDPRLFGYHGVNYFGSCMPSFVYQGMNRLGESWWSNRMWYGEGEPAAFDALMGVRYVLSSRDLSDEKGYERLVDTDRESVYRNDLALPIASLVDAGHAEELSDDIFESHNSLWASLATGVGDVFTEEEDVTFEYHEGVVGVPIALGEAREYYASASVLANPADQSGSAAPTDSQAREEDTAAMGQYIACSFTAKQDGPVYCCYGFAKDEDGGYALDYIRYVGRFKAGDTVRYDIKVDSSAIMTEASLKLICADCYFAYANDDALARYSKLIQERSGTVERVSDSHLRGHVDAGADSRLFLTVPYDGGWALRVDGVEVPLEMEAGLFMSAPMPAGAHDWELTFLPVGMRAGAAMSCGGLALAAGLAAWDRGRRRGAGGGPALPKGADAA